MKNLFLFLAFMFTFSIAHSQLESEITSDGVVFPRLTTIQRDALSAQKGQVIYNTTTDVLDVYDGSNWKALDEHVWSRNGQHAYYNDGNIGIGISIPVNPLSVVGTTSVNTVRVDGGIAPTGKDVVELIVDETSSNAAQFIEMQKGASIVAAINTDGAAKFKSVQFEDNSIQTKAAIGPIAFGAINSAGGISSGTGNFTCAWVAANNRYEITISGESYHFSLYATQLTPVSSTVRAVRSSSVNGKLLVYLYNSSGSLIQGEFHFSVFKP